MFYPSWGVISFSYKQNGSCLIRTAKTSLENAVVSVINLIFKHLLHSIPSEVAAEDFLIPLHE